MNLNEKYIKEGPYQYDDGRFMIWKARWGTWCSADAEGNRLCTSMSKEGVEFWSREHLDGFPNSWVSETDTRFTGKDTL